MQRAAALRNAQPERLALCEKFIIQCEVVISALQRSVPPRQDSAS